MAENDLSCFSDNTPSPAAVLLICQDALRLLDGDTSEELTKVLRANITTMVKVVCGKREGEKWAKEYKVKTERKSIFTKHEEATRYVVCRNVDQGPGSSTIVWLARGSPVIVVDDLATANRFAALIQEDDSTTEKPPTERKNDGPASTRETESDRTAGR